MISKKTKALTAGVLAAAMSASAVLPMFSSAADTERSYAAWFGDLYDDVVTNGQANGYLSQNNNGSGSFGIPYHALETCICEAPDYGHETTSEAMSYIVWMAAMRDVLGKQGALSSTSDLKKAWTTMEAMIPGWSKACKSSYDLGSIWTQERLKADTDYEYDTPEEYNGQNPKNDAVNPLYKEFASNYGSDPGYYMMHWLADVDDWYGYGGSRDSGSWKPGSFVFINTFQRGKEESCFETVPHPCYEELKYGNSSSGIKGIFNGPSVDPQYAFTNAPDAEDRTIQAVYFANRYGAGDSSVSALAGKMGDQCRNDMFDKYYKAIGCQNINTDSQSYDTAIKGQHYLMAWYTSWGGALKTSYGDYPWAWQIGCSHSHQFYQNPLAAYALLADSAINGGMKGGKQANDDYTESLKRQLEMYLWLQSKDGPIAGGCTNSWNGRYEKYPSGTSTFYDMAYVEHPVYADPGSNHWIGNQVWSVQRLAELYYIIKSGDGNSTVTNSVKPGGLSMEDALDAILSRWVDWFINNMKWNEPDENGNILPYAMPSNLDWSGQPATWEGNYSETANSGLTCEITSWGMSDVGCISSLCNTLITYAAAKGVDASAADSDNNTDVAAKGLRVANKLLGMQWDLGRDEVGVNFTEHNGSLKRFFEGEVYIPKSYTGTMPDGSKLANGATFSSIRESYAEDPKYQELKAAYDKTGSTESVDLEYHRFWHEGDVAMAMGTMALLYPTVTPYEDGDTPGETLYGDTDCDGTVAVNDAVLILQSLANPTKYSITAQGKINGDCNKPGAGLDAEDALAIQKACADLVTLPIM